MKNILIALILIAVAASCSKKEDETEPTPPPKNLQTFALDTSAPFITPIIDWTKGPDYVKANPPGRYVFVSLTEKESQTGVRPISFHYYKEMKFLVPGNSPYPVMYYFGKDDKLIGVIIRDDESIYSNSVNYFEKKLGKPTIDNSQGKMWEAKNVTIGTPHMAAVYTDIAFVKPSEVKL